jgi:predicted metalloprotease with PDZ domain
VTTYKGDLYLLKSGVFDLANYFLEFNNQLQKHFDNAGRFNYSVAQSSFDTWLDGYVPGIPGRKTSIYTEGCLLAFVSDIYIRRTTNNQKGLEDAMCALYTDFAQKRIGYTSEIYKQILESTAGISFDSLFTNYFYGTEDYEQILNECLNYLGLKIAKIDAKSYSENKLGIKSLPKNGNAVITAVASDSPASFVCSIGDEIISVNGFKLNNDLDNWLAFSASETNSLTIIRNGKLQEITLTANDSTYYPKYEVQLQEQLSEEQKIALKAWAEIKN